MYIPLPIFYPFHHREANEATLEILLGSATYLVLLVYGSNHTQTSYSSRVNKLAKVRGGAGREPTFRVRFRQNDWAFHPSEQNTDLFVIGHHKAKYAFRIPYAEVEYLGPWWGRW